jgi:hypothetical protein
MGSPVIPIFIVLAALGALLLSMNASASSGSNGNSSAYSSQLVSFAQAISVAEGFGIAGAIPTTANNPGDLELGGNVINGVTVFGSVNDGWNALYNQLQLIVNGNSGVYNLNMTISDMAYSWTATEQDAWAENVSTELGVTPDTPLSQVLS